MFGKLKARRKEGTVGGASTTAARLSRDNSVLHRDSLTRNPREEAGGEYNYESPTRLDSARSGKSSKIGGSSSNRKASKQNSSVKLPPLRDPRMEMAAEMAIYGGGEEEGKRHYSQTTRPVASGGVNDHLSASLPRTRGVGNLPLPSAFSSSAPPSMGGRNHLSALIADPEIEDFCDDTQKCINAGEASTYALAKHTQAEKMRSRRNDSNHHDRKASERKDPFRPGSANGDKDTEKRRSSKRSDHSLKRNSDKKKAGRRLSQQENFLGSLEDCLGGMGFDPADIKKAVKSTDAKSSADAADVVEWLAEHHDELGGSNIKNDDEDIKDVIVGPHSPPSMGTERAPKSMATTLTADSDRRVQSLNEMRLALGNMRLKRETNQRQSSKNSLEDCVEDMGFDPANIRKAIESTDAKSSADVAKVVEWLAEHHDELGGSNIIHDDEDIKDDSVGPQSAWSLGTGSSAKSMATTMTVDSDQWIQELQESLRELGFTHKDISKKRELFRQHSGKMTVEKFISAMMEVEAEDSSSSSDDSSMDEKRASPGHYQGERGRRKHEHKHNNGEHRSNFVDCRTQTSGANAFISDIAEVNETNKQVQELDNSLRDLGCRPDLVEERRKMYR